MMSFVVINFLLSFPIVCLVWDPGHEVIKLFFMLNSTEHEFFPPINVKMPTNVQQNSILGLPEPTTVAFLDIFILMSI